MMSETHVELRAEALLAALLDEHCKFWGKLSPDLTDRGDDNWEPQSISIRGRESSRTKCRYRSVGSNWKAKGPPFKILQEQASKFVSLASLVSNEKLLPLVTPRPHTFLQMSSSTAFGLSLIRTAAVRR